MSDQDGALPLGLAQQQAAKNVDPEQLESMGKRAAALYAERHMPLNEAVVEIVKEARLAPEQVKRVCEFANTAAYLFEFEKGGAVRNVTFEGGPANPASVLQDLNDGSSPPPRQVKTSGYQPPKSHYKTAMASDSILAEAFGVRPGLEKVAEVSHSVRANPGEEIADLRIRLEGIRDDLKSKYASSGVLLLDVRRDLCDAVRQEVLTGTTLGDIVTAWMPYSDSVEMLKQAMPLIFGHLTATQTMTREEQQKSLTKTASISRIPNPDHPVIDRFIAFTKISHEHAKLEEALKIVGDQLRDVNQKLGEML
jgi:hypothetical protein